MVLRLAWRRVRFPQPPAHLHVAASSSGSLLYPEQAIQELENPRSEPAFYTLILEVTSHHLYSLLFVRHESVCTAHTQGRGLHKSKHLEMKALSPCSKTACVAAEKPPLLSLPLPYFIPS
jgi:hypothetical protein